MAMGSKASIFFAIALSGCAATQSAEIKQPNSKVTETPNSNAGGFECVAESIQYAIGKQATADLAGQLMKESGSTSLRWIPPDTAVTLDYRVGRLNISYDYEMKVTQVSCG